MVALSFLNPDFEHGFLAGKEELFNGFWFPSGLYLHAFTAPVTLFLVSLLVLYRIEKYVVIHRFLGRSALILLFIVVIPSGWVLSYFAMGGSLGKFAFFVLTSYTAFAAFQGYTAIRNKHTRLHRYWMLEVLLLLSSAIVLRLLLVLFQKQFAWFGDTPYATAAILSWVPSIVLMKLLKRTISE